MMRTTSLQTFKIYWNREGNLTGYTGLALFPDNHLNNARPFLNQLKQISEHCAAGYNICCIKIFEEKNKSKANDCN